MAYALNGAGPTATACAVDWEGGGWNWKDFSAQGGDALCVPAEIRKMVPPGGGMASPDPYTIYRKNPLNYP